MRSTLHWLLSLVLLVGVCSSFYRKEPKDTAIGASKGTGNGRQGVSSPEQAKAIVATVKECVASKMQSRKFKKVTPQKSVYTLMSSHTLEKINALSPHQLKQIEFITGCVQEHVPHLFWDSESSSEVYNRFGGSNVTFLTGILPQVLPELSESLLSTLRKGLTSPYWKHMEEKAQRNYGIRAVYVISADRPGYDLFFHMNRAFRAKALPKTLEVPATLPATDAPLYQRFHQYFYLQGRDWQAYRSKFMSDHRGSDFTLFAAVTDFHDSCLADYLLHRHATEKDVAIESEDDYEDIEAIRRPAEYEHMDLLSEVKASKVDEDGLRRLREEAGEENESFSRDAFENYTPERGNVLLIRGNSHGPNELLCGQRVGLIIEYWPFKDAPLQVGIPTTAQGEELGLLPQNDHLQEL